MKFEGILLIAKGMQEHTAVENINQSVHTSRISADDALNQSINFIENGVDHQVSEEIKPFNFILPSPNGLHLPSLKSVKRGPLMKIVNVVNDLYKIITTSTLAATVNLMFAAARVGIWNVLSATITRY